MTTVASRDGTRIAYDRVGEGPPVVLLHGGFVQDRTSWRKAGYVARLADKFSLLAVDLRGHGESGRPTAPEDYAAPRMCEDVVAVLDAERIERAAVWGFSFGAGVALQLAASSDRVTRVAAGGAQLGPWLTEEALKGTLIGIQRLAEARRNGVVEELPIPEMQKVFARTADFDVAAATTRAMAAWPVIEPALVRCPALYYAGASNAWGVKALEAFAASLAQAGARTEILDGLDHMGEFEALDRVVPLCAPFLGVRSA